MQATKGCEAKPESKMHHMTAKKLERMYAAVEAGVANADKIAAEIEAIEAKHGVCIVIPKKEEKMVEAVETVETLKEELRQVMARYADANKAVAAAVKWERTNCASGIGHADGKQDDAMGIFKSAWEIDKKICEMVWTLEETKKRRAEWNEFARNIPASITRTDEKLAWIESNVSWAGVSTVRHTRAGGKMHEMREAIERFKESGELN